MEQVAFPPGWEHHAAPVATLLQPLGPPALAWLFAALLLAAAYLVARRRPTLAIALAAVAALALAIAADGLVDDAYIQFRYAANLAAGHGPVFNPGERIEGASGGSWIGILAAVGAATGLGPAIAGRLLGLALAPIAVLLAGATGARLAPGHGPSVALAWAALPTASLYAATGLETGAYAAALWLLAWGLARDSQMAAAAGAVLAATLRPEALGLVILTLPFWRRLPRAARAAALAGLAAVVAVAGARFLYYGSPVPNAAVVKGVTGAAGMAKGIGYLGGALAEWWPLLLALPVLARRFRSLAPAIVPATAWLTVVVARGGDWMPGSRYLLPPLVLLVVAVGLSPHRLRLAATGLLLVASLVRLVPLQQSGPLQPGDLWRAMAEHRVQSRWWEAIGTWLGDVLPPTSLIATGPAGAIPFASGLPTFDLYGLNTRVTRAGGGTPGHTLWGLPEAVATGCVAIYPGTPVPQQGGPQALLSVARSEAARAPALAEHYRPVMLTHAPEYAVDVLQDILWLRVDLHAPPGLMR